MGADGDARAHLFGDLADGGVLRGVVGGERVDRHDRRYTVQAHVLDLLAQVVRPSVDVVGVFFQQLRWQGFSGDYVVAAGVNLQCPHGGYQHRRVRLQARGPAFDVEEPLCAHVRAEARLGHKEVPAADADQVRHDGRVAVCDVAEGPGMDQNRRVLQGLHQVGLYRLAHDHRHGARGFEVFGRDKASVYGAPDHDPSQPRAHVL